jgi:hypothetical protein
MSPRSKLTEEKMGMNPNHPRDARDGAAQMRTMLTELIDQARADVVRVDDLRARALFEVTAEVLLGLRNAYEDFEEGRRTAWKKAS